MRRVSVLAVAVVFAAAVLVLGSTSRQTIAQTATPPATNQGFVGAWRLDSETSFGASQSLVTFMADGTVRFSDRPVLPGNAGVPDTFISAGHGAWDQTGPPPRRPTGSSSSPTARGTSWSP